MKAKLRGAMIVIGLMSLVGCGLKGPLYREVPNKTDNAQNKNNEFRKQTGSVLSK